MNSTRRKVTQFAGILLAALALSIAAASGASGAEFRSEVNPTQVLGKSTTEISISVNGGTFKCKTAQYAGVMSSNPAKELLVHPTYEGCTFWGAKLEVSTAGCNYAFTAPTKTSANMQILCEAGKEIVFNNPIPGCSIIIKGQTPTKNAQTLSNSTTGIRTFEIGGQVAGITYTTVGNGTCGESGENMVMGGPVLMKGFKDVLYNKQVGIWVE